MNIIRLPFRWERLQQSLGGDLNAAELARMDVVVAEATAKKVYIILDPHNYARYNGNLIGSSTVSQDNYVDLWKKLSAHYKSNGYVFFALMNEPYGIDVNTWLSAANAAIAGIRAQGAVNLILVPGISWTGAHSWLTSGNSTTMVNVKDSGNNFAFEVHQYFDSDSSGSSDTCSTTTGSTRLSDFTSWLKANNFKGFLGEFAGGNNTDCKAAVTDALTYMRSNSSVWIGWTWWAAGPMWGTYQFTLEPTNNFTTDAAQMSWLTPYL
jgi:endoglucanase